MITVNDQSGVPIYLQIVEGMKREILTGIFGPDDRLPSIRDLAVELKVNPNTIAKAYQELETLGVIYFRRGQGAFVAPRTEEDRMKEARKEIMDRLAEILEIAERMGLTREALRSLLEDGLKNASLRRKA